MANAFVQNIMHVTFHVATGCSLNADNLPRLYDYIGGIANNLGGTLIAAGGVSDHIHLLVSVPKTLSLSDFISRLKSNSSRWLKTVDARYRAFSWQDGYGAFSVSASMIGTVKGYIANQAEHHRRVTYVEELNKFWETYINHVPPLRGSDA